MWTKNTAYHSSKYQTWPPLSHQPLQHARAHTHTHTHTHSLLKGKLRMEEKNRILALDIRCIPKE